MSRSRDGIQEVTFHARVAWIPDPPGRPTWQQGGSPLSPPPADLDMENPPWEVQSPEEPESSPQDIPVPRSDKELWAAVITRAKQRFNEERDNDEWVPSSSKQHEGPLMHHKIKWQLAQLIALIALCEDDSVQAYNGLWLKPELWGADPEVFQRSLDRSIDRMMEDLAQVATIWMLAKDGQDKAKSALETGKGKADKGKGKAVVPAKRSEEGGVERLDAAKRQRLQQEPEPEPQHQERDEKDKAAQEKVRQWYDNVSVLTGHGLSDGAHIFGVGARARAAHLFDLFDTMGNFWPADKVGRWYAALDSDATRLQNILPMEPTVHKMFDRFLFALRPVQCPLERTKRIYLQLDCQLAMNPNTFRREDSRPKNLRWLSNYRVPTKDGQGPTYLRHGQVLEIVSKDEDKLPSYEILEVTYALTRIIGALKGAGLLELVFRGDPPDVDPVPAEDAGVRLPPFQELLLSAALEAGVFTTEQAPKWRAAALVQEAAEQAAVDDRQIAFLRLAGLMPQEQPAEEREEKEDGEEHSDGRPRSKTTQST